MEIKFEIAKTGTHSYIECVYDVIYKSKAFVQCFQSAVAMAYH